MWDVPLSNKPQRCQGGNQDTGSREGSYGNDPLILVVPGAQSERFSSWSGNPIYKENHKDKVVEEEKALRKEVVEIEEMKEKIKELEKQCRDEIKRKGDNDEGLTIEEMREWLRIKEEGEIENMEKRKASKEKDHKDNVAEEKEEGNKMREEKEKEKSQKEEARDRKEEERGKREFWEMIKEQEERERQKRVEVRRKVLKNRS
jgi:hypothetical protein